MAKRPKGRQRPHMMRVLVSYRELDIFQRMADEEGLNLSESVRRTLLQEAQRRGYQIVDKVVAHG